MQDRATRPTDAVEPLPRQARHDAARRGALAEIESSLAASQKRMAQLLESRKRYLEEAEFYPNGNLPAKLRRDIDANSALIAAQAQAIESQKEDAARKNAFYDEELAKLKKLWLPERATAAPASRRPPRHEGRISAAGIASCRTAPRAPVGRVNGLRSRPAPRRRAAPPGGRRCRRTSPSGADNRPSRCPGSSTSAARERSRCRRSCSRRRRCSAALASRLSITP